MSNRGSFTAFSDDSALGEGSRSDEKMRCGHWLPWIEEDDCVSLCAQSLTESLERVAGLVFAADNSGPLWLHLRGIRGIYPWINEP